MKEVRVSSNTNHKKLAAMVLYEFENGAESVALISIGPQSTNQAVKAVIHLRTLSGVDYCAVPQWRTLSTKKGVVSAIMQVITPLLD